MVIAVVQLVAIVVSGLYTVICTVSWTRGFEISCARANASPVKAANLLRKPSSSRSRTFKDAAEDAVNMGRPNLPLTNEIVDMNG